LYSPADNYGLIQLDLPYSGYALTTPCRSAHTGITYKPVVFQVAQRHIDWYVQQLLKYNYYDYILSQNNFLSIIPGYSEKICDG
jgi:hypothetical protein